MHLTSLDLIQALWSQDGILALGWIICLFLACYIGWQQRQHAKDLREHVKFAQTQANAMLPVLAANTAAMERVIRDAADTADHLHNINNRSQRLMGKVEMVLTHFVGHKPEQD